jgi:Domain of unknown function (DUF4149)
LLRCATNKLRALLALVWAGQLLCVAFLAAPNAFATLARPEASAYVSRLFLWDARISLAMGVLMLLFEQRLQRDKHPGRVRFTPLLWLPLGVLFITIGGQEALQPIVAAAKAGHGNFALAHGLSMAAFAAKTLAVLALGWLSFSSCLSASASRA